MPLLRGLILANSVKKHARCIAAREVLSSATGPLQLGNWIRPVTRVHEGAIEAKQLRLCQGGIASVLDVVDIPLTQAASDPGQPENWYFDENRQWSKVGVIPPSELIRFTDTPADLWLTGTRSDRIPETVQAERSAQHSLALIEPQSLQVHLWTERNPFEGYNQRKTRVHFDYRGTNYDMSMTDPAFSSTLPQHPSIGSPCAIWTPPPGTRWRLCVSLTPSFNGFHYKVVATVIRV